MLFLYTSLLIKDIKVQLI